MEINIAKCSDKLERGILGKETNHSQPLLYINSIFSIFGSNLFCSLYSTTTKINETTNTITLKMQVPAFYLAYSAFE